MATTTRLMICITAVLNLPAMCLAQAANESAQWQQILMELRNLRIELMQEKIERANARLSEIQIRIHHAETERENASQLERSQARQPAELQERLLQPGLLPEDRAEMENQRVLLMTEGAARVAERRAAAERLETELRNQFSAQQQVLMKLLEALGALSSGSTR